MSAPTETRGPESYTIAAGVFRRALATALRFIDPDGITPAIDGVSVRPANTGRLVEVAATDRYTLSVETVPVDDETRATFETLIPTHIVRRLLAVIPAGTRRRPVEGDVTLSLDATQRVAVAYIGDPDGFDVTITFTRPGREAGGLFPDYTKILANLAKVPEDDRIPHMHVQANLLARVAKALNARMPKGSAVAVDTSAHRRPVTFATPDGELTIILMPCCVTEH